MALWINSGGWNGFRLVKKRFKQLLQDNSPHDFDEQSENILQALKEYKGDNERQDDVTVVGFGF